MFTNELIKSVEERSRNRANGRNKRCGRGNNGHKARGRGWMNMGIQNGGQNPFFRMHGKIGFNSQLRTKIKIKLIDGIKLKNFKGEINHDSLFKLKLINQREYSRKIKFKILNKKFLKG